MKMQTVSTSRQQFSSMEKILEALCIIQFISKLNHFESLNMSMVPQIENPTNKLDIGNSKKEIHIHNIFIENKIKCDLCVLKQ